MQTTTRALTSSPHHHHHHHHHTTPHYHQSINQAPSFHPLPPTSHHHAVLLGCPSRSPCRPGRSRSRSGRSMAHDVSHQQLCLLLHGRWFEKHHRPLPLSAWYSVRGLLRTCRRMVATHGGLLHQRLMRE